MITEGKFSYYGYKKNYIDKKTGMKMCEFEFVDFENAVDYSTRISFKESAREYLALRILETDSLPKPTNKKSIPKRKGERLVKITVDMKKEINNMKSFE